MNGPVISGFSSSSGSFSSSLGSKSTIFSSGSGSCKLGVDVSTVQPTNKKIMRTILKYFNILIVISPFIL